mgnify:CR=1 FL=1
MKLISKFFVFTVLWFSSFASAELEPYSQEVYKKAMAEGKSVVLDFHASWCPTCWKQGPALNEILKMPEFKSIVALKADYDSEKELKSELKISKQATVVVFKSGKEVGRSTGVTAKEELKKLIELGK